MGFWETASQEPAKPCSNGGGTTLLAQRAWPKEPRLLPAAPPPQAGVPWSPSLFLLILGAPPPNTKGFVQKGAVWEQAPSHLMPGLRGSWGRGRWESLCLPCAADALQEPSETHARQSWEWATLNLFSQKTMWHGARAENQH